MSCPSSWRPRVAGVIVDAMPIVALTVLVGLASALAVALATTRGAPRTAQDPPPLPSSAATLDIPTLPPGIPTPEIPPTPGPSPTPTPTASVTPTATPTPTPTDTATVLATYTARPSPTLEPTDDSPPATSPAPPTPTSRRLWLPVAHRKASLP
jgi:hypothetical protein